MLKPKCQLIVDAHYQNWSLLAWKKPKSSFSCMRKTERQLFVHAQNKMAAFRSCAKQNGGFLCMRKKKWWLASPFENCALRPWMSLTFPHFSSARLRSLSQILHMKKTHTALIWHCRVIVRICWCDGACHIVIHSQNTAILFPPTNILEE